LRIAWIPHAGETAAGSPAPENRQPFHRREGSARRASSHACDRTPAGSTAPLNGQLHTTHELLNFSI